MPTGTPIQHVVVIFQENVSFDHYFGTYPKAANTSGQTFHAAGDTPTVNGLSDALLTANPNGVNPRRYDPASVNDILTCDQNHDYTAEQKSFDNGAMDKFPQTVGTGSGTSATKQPCVAGDVMNYYDGNTVTALWNYAQHFAMSDNSFNTTFGPSTPGAINLISGETGTVGLTTGNVSSEVVSNGKGGFSVTGDPQPYYDDCDTRDTVQMTGQNAGDSLNAAGVSWGFFEGGFKPTTAFAGPGTKAVCGSKHPIGAAVGGTGQYGFKGDYVPHHQPFQYYASTANPHHLPPASLKAIGTDTQTIVGGTPQFDTANHQYDMNDWDKLVASIATGDLPASQLPAVSFLKAPGYQDGHAFYSDPIDEQQFVVNQINALEKTPAWKSTAVVVAYDDSDGWYDHVYSGVTNPSQTAADALTGPGQCGTSSAAALAGEQGRCGYGPRLPLLVISPWAKENAVDHTLTDQSSILRFIENNWQLPRIAGSFDAVAGSLGSMFDFTQQLSPARTLFLDPSTGQPVNPM
jgi:phospholipase C